jgi:hypothetical protein
MLVNVFHLLARLSGITALVSLFSCYLPPCSLLLCSMYCSAVCYRPTVAKCQTDDSINNIRGSGQGDTTALGNHQSDS